MRVLELSAYAYFKGHKGFEKNNSGFAYAVSDICKALISCGNEVFLLTQSGITDGFKYDGITVLRKRWTDIIFHFQFGDLINGLRAIRGSSVSAIEKFKTVYYYINRGYAEKIIKTIRPNIIHIQSIGNYTVPFMIAASNTSTPYIVSNHGLATFLTEVDSKLKEMEKSFFRAAEKNNTIVTTVSSGIKQKLLVHFGLKGENIIVVPNGFMPSINKINTQELDFLRKQLKISRSDFVYICVGSISNRKNQLQVARAFHLLLDKTDSIKLLFAGDGPQFNELKEYVQVNNLENKITLLGNVEHSKMPYYYCLSNCTVMASVDEGFGMSIIEGYSFGIPAVLYGDLDAAADISSSVATIVVNRRGDEELSAGMTLAASTEWNEEIIKEYAMKFTNKEMGIKYQNALKMGIKTISTMPIEDVVRLVTGKE